MLKTEIQQIQRGRDLLVAIRALHLREGSVLYLGKRDHRAMYADMQRTLELLDSHDAWMPYDGSHEFKIQGRVLIRCETTPAPLVLESLEA